MIRHRYSERAAGRHLAFHRVLYWRRGRVVIRPGGSARHVPHTEILKIAPDIKEDFKLIMIDWHGAYEILATFSASNRINRK